MAKKFEVRWLYDGHYTIDTVEADTADEAVSTVECCFNTAKEYRIISVKEIKSKGDTTMAKKSNKKLYVAYGSNLHLGQMAYRCPEAKVYGAGVLKNYELTFWGNWGRNGVATVIPKTGTDVPVGIWEISKNDERNLDIYEGWPRLYRKEDIEVTMEDGSIVTAMVYIMNENGMRDTYPSDSYFNTIATGYKSFGFDLEFLKAARDRISVRDFRFKNF